VSAKAERRRLLLTTAKVARLRQCSGMTPERLFVQACPYLGLDAVFLAGFFANVPV
jgi:hypothetical protein